MVQFRDIEPDDISQIKPLLEAADFFGNDYCLSNIFNWRCAYNSQIAFINNFFVIKLHLPEPAYLFPAGFGDITPVIDALIADAKECGAAFRLVGIEPKAKQQLEQLLPHKFVFEELRDNFDYVYSREKLATLAGKKLHSKRTNINHFLKEAPDWSYEPITPENLEECRRMHSQWRSLNNCSDNSPSNCDHSGLVKEKCAVRNAFANFFELGMEGGLLRVNGKVVAFAAGVRYRRDSFIVNIEKAFLTPDGTYAMINNQFASHLPEDVLYINREDDFGDPGLRRAKLSYKPDMMIEKFAATLA